MIFNIGNSTHKYICKKCFDSAYLSKDYFVKLTFKFYGIAIAFSGPTLYFAAAR